MQIPCVYLPGPAPAVSVANTYSSFSIGYDPIKPLCQCCIGFTVAGQNQKQQVFLFINLLITYLPTTTSYVLLILQP